MADTPPISPYDPYANTCRAGGYLSNDVSISKSSTVTGCVSEDTTVAGRIRTLPLLSLVSFDTLTVGDVLTQLLPALLLYEYFITFDREIGIAWSHKLSWGKAIFLFSRYIGLLLVLQGFAFEFLPGPIFVRGTVSPIQGNNH